jgi:nicotinate phosphoribosyltransferase
MDVFVSSGVDEYFLKAFLEEAGVADGFGPGTSLTTSKDAPTLNPVYKLVAVEKDGTMQPSMKLSKGKVTFPGSKSVHRFGDDEFRRDVVADISEDLGGRELLVDVVSDGEVVYDFPTLEGIRERTMETLERLPPEVRAIKQPAAYPVDVSDGLTDTAERVQSELRQEMGL